MYKSHSKKNIEESKVKYNIFYRFKKILFEIDWSFSRFLLLFLNRVVFLSLLIISSLSIIFQALNIFEYDEGLSDISTIEILFIFSLLILLRRYYIYTKKTSMHWWDRLVTPLIVNGKFILITLFLFSFITITDSYNHTYFFNKIIIQYQSYLQLLLFAYLLISLYISIPSKDLRIKKQSIKQQIANNEELKTKKGI